MDTILQRRSEGHKDETQLKISAQVKNINIGLKARRFHNSYKTVCLSVRDSSDR